MENKLIPKVFLWMTVGLLVTFGTGLFVSTNEAMVINIFTSGLHWILMLVELGLVIFLSARVTRMRGTTAKVFFLLYSFVSGLTFSSIFVVYEITSIMYLFLIAAIIFAVFGAIGYFTKIDLTKLGSFLMMGLFAVIVCMILNIFIKNGQFDFVLSLISILIFMGFTAYDIQTIKRLENSGIPEENLAIIGALNLYLDYINIFIHLLSIFGNSKD